MPGSTSVVHTLRYNDADAAVRWLEQALGFTQHTVYRHPEEHYILHAELVHRRKDGGIGMVMLGSAQFKSETSTHYRQPREAGGVTSSAYLIVDDCDPVYASAQTAGAEVLMDLRTMDYGGKAFAVRDPEGHIWSVGEYDPFTFVKS